jgi:nitrogen fixation/metabolism regulation signal transduction histidine kinase
VPPVQERASAVNEELHRRLRERELACFGRIAADVGHDIRNVLSIIGENAGLLDDLLAAAEHGKRLDYETLKRIAASITRQAKNGTGIMDEFSRFAHAADPQPPAADLTALAGTVAALAQRQARLAGCTLQAELPDEAIRVRANPFSLQHVLFSAVQVILECVESGAAATLKLAAQGPAAAVSVTGKAACEEGELPGRISTLAEPLEELQASVETSCKEGVVSLIMTIPIPSTA